MTTNGYRTAVRARTSGRFIRRVFHTLMAVSFLSSLVLVYSMGKPFLVGVNAQTDLNVRPYVAEDIDFVIKNNQELVISREKVFRRRDGGIFRAGILYRPDGSENAHFSRIDLPDGRFAMIVDAMHAKSSGHRSVQDAQDMLGNHFEPGDECAQRARPEANFPGDVVDGGETLFGHLAVRVIMKLPESSERTVSLRLLVLGCAEVETFQQAWNAPTSEWRTVGGKRLVALSETDPDPKVFTEWESYKEMSLEDLTRPQPTNKGVTP